MLTFKDLQDEVKRRATRDQGGSQYDIAVNNVINSSLLRLAREAPWRMLRRKNYFTTVTSYTTGTGSVTVANSATSASITGATFISDGVNVGRRVDFGTDDGMYTIRAVPGEAILTLDRAYEGTSSTGTDYEIYPQEEYNLPIQAGHRVFLWHEDYGYPYKMHYVPDQTFYETGVHTTEEGTPTHYRMWGENMAIAQPHTATTIGIYSTTDTDTAIDVMVFGTVAGYPDSEKITTHATDSLELTSSTKLFSEIERISKDVTTGGRINVTDTTSTTTLAVIPAGDATAGILYKKVQLYPLPQSAFDINIQYYKDPYRLVADEDIHELGQEFDEAIILLSVAKIKYETNQKEGDRFLAMYRDEVRNLRKTNADKIDWFPKLQKPKDSRRDLLAHGHLYYRQVGSQYGPSSRR
jgi:hypothetical protein